MTPDSPKGPEREAQIEIKRLEENEEFLERAVHLMLGCCDASDVPCEERDAEALYTHVRNGTTPITRRAMSSLLRGMATKASDFRRALAFADAHVPRWERIIAEHKAEVERLTAEVERLRQAGRIIAQSSERFFHANAEKADQVERLQAQYDQAVEDWGRNDEEMLAENQRLAEQVSRLREQLAAQQALPQEFRQRAERAMASVDDNEEHLDECDSPAECHAAAKNFAWRMAATLVENALGGVSSSEVEAPRPEPLQHSTHTWENGGVWHGLCVTFECGERVKGCQAAVEYWKDQHEADTLRPKAFADYDLTDVKPGTGFFVEKAVEGRPSGSERLALRPVLATPNSAAVGDRVKFERWESDWDPAERAPERTEGVVVASRPAGRNFVDVLTDDGRTFYGVSSYDVTSRQDAAQAARSEATPKTQCQWWMDDRQCPDWAEQGFDLCGGHIVQHNALTAPDAHLPRNATFAVGDAEGRPSPSLRKEGGDSD